MNDLLDTKAAAPRIGVCVGTLENWRTQGRGPRFIKSPGRRGKVLYDPADIEAWKDANRFQSTSETAAA
ncbi:MAG: helix-turn-helix domain-containing protein [Croceibacterium sp.]